MGSPHLHLHFSCSIGNSCNNFFSCKKPRQRLYINKSYDLEPWDTSKESPLSHTHNITRLEDMVKSKFTNLPIDNDDALLRVKAQLDFDWESVPLRRQHMIDIAQAIDNVKKELSKVIPL